MNIIMIYDTVKSKRTISLQQTRYKVHAETTWKKINVYFTNVYTVKGIKSQRKSSNVTNFEIYPTMINPEYLPQNYYFHAQLVEHFENTNIK